MATKSVAFCWRSGLIGFGYSCPEGALPIARDYDKRLRGVVEVLATLGYDNETLRVGGVATADDDGEALLAVQDFQARVNKRLEALRA